MWNPWLLLRTAGGMGWLMARLERLVVPNTTYHVTHRGERRDPVFFEAADWPVCLSLLMVEGLRSFVSVMDSVAKKCGKCRKAFGLR